MASDTDQNSLISAPQGPEGELWVLKAAAQPHLIPSKSLTSFHRLDCPLPLTAVSAGHISAITSPIWLLLQNSRRMLLSLQHFLPIVAQPVWASTLKIVSQILSLLILAPTTLLSVTVPP